MRISAAVVVFVIALAVVAEASQSDSAPAPAVVDTAEFARLSGRVEALQSQLETERAINEKVLATVDTVISVYTAAAALVAFLLAFFGYANLRTHLEKQLDARLDARLKGLIEEKLEPRLQRKEADWDQRFETLFKRVEHLSDQAGP